MKLDLQVVRDKFVALTDVINAEKDGSSELTAEDVAVGFLSIANATMTRPIRALSEGRGFETAAHNLCCFVWKIESRIAKAGFNHALTRLHSISGLKKVLHKRERKPHALELNVMYFKSDSLCSLRSLQLKLVDIGDVGRALDVADNGCTTTPAGKFGGEGYDRPKTRALWNRERRYKRRYKRRHYFDVVSLYRACLEVWTSEGHGRLFASIAKRLLFDAVSSQLDYGRIYLTMSWIWAGPYWIDIGRYVLDSGLLKLSDAQYRLACKETTAQVARSWFFPKTNTQHIAYPERAQGTRSFEAYLRQYSLAAESLVEPLYARYNDKAVSLDEMLRTRVAWGAGGVSGRRARELLGPDVAPAGSAKGYVLARTGADLWRKPWGTTYVETADKSDERGVTRTIAATDMRDQLSEQVAFKAITNRYPEVGLDIGESPTQAMARHLNLAVASERRDVDMHDGKVIMCWDWQAWDHLVHSAERVLVLQAMLKMSRKYLSGAILKDVETELLALVASADELVFRSQAYADERYSQVVDDIITASEGRARRLPGHAGQFAISIDKPNGQQSGRKSTLEGNTGTKNNGVNLINEKIEGLRPGRYSQRPTLPLGLMGDPPDDSPVAIFLVLALGRQSWDLARARNA
ncbi:uncharacterized protein N7515_008967 [Penicillium bovifimosum]|uniref:Hydantoinase A/oxoprolinase domain-containing protein n=1 Tax=Penicillium bovifimosum TaxID=126998 RepID=A0A9W9GIR5_9EURO|nr:uncharacterized protein N7515_008967 [Penicillium bovifimosum]KAJ5121006.1 hypothetical protein N7515_008967 [Penicillium bovifimosum]